MKQTTTTDTMTDYKKEIMEEWKKNINDLGCCGGNSLNCDGYKRHEARMSNFLSQALDRVAKEAKREEITENTSDGYHTFKELYEFRKLYNAALFNEWAKQGMYGIHKSKRHHDGELCFGGGWFIVMAQLPTGQISNHYELKDWGLFQCEEREKAEEWDGHTAQDVAKRLSSLLSTPDALQEKKEEHE